MSCCLGYKIPVEYTYDENGNMITDANKGISKIEYNHLNLPTKIILGAGTINYMYDATGVKQQKTISTGASTDYVGSFVYDNNVLRQFSQPEGYLIKNGSVFNYIYQYKDHLGNIRLSYQDKNNNGAVNTAEIVQENNYYPFGLLQEGYNSVVNGVDNKYKYNGKELQDEIGLDFYDYGARNYDSALGRWMNVDPLAEVSSRWSPFNYAYNNPIIFVDPDGMQARYNWEEHDKGNKGVYTDDETKENVSFSDVMASQGLNANGSDNEDDCCGDSISGVVKGLWDGLIELQISVIPGANLVDLATGGNLFRANVKEEEKNAYYAGVILFALLEPSPGGEANLLKKIATKVTKKHGLFKCIQCADELVKTLKSKGISGQILEVTTNGNKGMAANIWSDTMQANISTNGKHKAVLIDNIVYDNIHKNGIKYSDWVKDLFSPTGYKITKKVF